jgi:hypothetical protein
LRALEVLQFSVQGFYDHLVAFVFSFQVRCLVLELPLQTTDHSLQFLVPVSVEVALRLEFVVVLSEYLELATLLLQYAFEFVAVGLLPPHFILVFPFQLTFEPIDLLLLGTLFLLQQFGRVFPEPVLEILEFLVVRPEQFVVLLLPLQILLLLFYEPLNLLLLGGGEL